LGAATLLTAHSDRGKGCIEDTALSSAKGSTESQIIEAVLVRAARGDRTAQDQLLETYWPTISSAVRIYKARAGGFNAREQTADLLQEAAIRILEKLPQAQWQGRKAFVAWVKMLAQTRAADLRKFHGAQKRNVRVDTAQSRGDIAPAKRSPESAIDQQGRLAALGDELDRLKPEYASAVRFFHMGYTHAEIGEMLGCTPEAARKLVARGHAQLAQRSQALKDPA